MRTRTLLLVLLAAVHPLAAQEAPPAPVSPPPAAVPVPAPEPAAPLLPPPPVTPSVLIAPEAAVAPTVSKGKDTLSVDFPDEDVRTILRNVADLFELNLVMPDTLQGRTSLKLRDVTWRQIFQVVLSPVGYTFLEEANIIKIISLDTLSQEPVSTEVFIINYAKASDILPSVSQLVDTAAPVNGKAMVDSRSNALIISERPSRMNRIRPIIEKLDKATDQVMIESKFVEINDNGSKNIGVDWATLGGYGLETGEITNTVAGAATAGNTLNSVVNTSGVTSATFSATNFQILLRALKTRTDSKLVSNPTIVTLNNAPAEINIGEEYPIPNYTYNQERGSFEISGFTYKPIGILLRVTPQVNSQGFIRLTLEPEISERGENANLGGAVGSTAEIPIITTRKTKTQVSLKDGHTLGIGGLIRDLNRNAQTKVPVLGSIPGLGRLFRSDTTTTERRNLLIFITARTVSAEDASVQEIFDPRQVKDANLKRSDLPGFRSEADPFVPEDAVVPPRTGKPKSKK